MKLPGFFFAAPDFCLSFDLPMEITPSLSVLDDLLERISAALRGLPGARELYLFGSAADPFRKDRYSDLDLRVISAQFDLSRAAWSAVLSRVGKMALVFPLDPEEPGCPGDCLHPRVRGPEFLSQSRFRDHGCTSGGRIFPQAGRQGAALAAGSAGCAGG